LNYLAINYLSINHLVSDLKSKIVYFRKEVFPKTKEERKQ